MKNNKSIILFGFIMGLSLIIIGCGVLASDPSEPEVVSGQSGELPVWLSLAHYEATIADDWEEEGLESDDDFFLGEDRDNTNATSTQAPPEPQTPSGTGNQAPPTSSSAPPANNEEDTEPPPDPGTMAYIIWQREQREAAAEKAKKDREKEEEKGKSLQERVWEMTIDSLNPSLGVDIKEPKSDDGQQQPFGHQFNMN